jgi:hypothetical protein
VIKGDDVAMSLRSLLSAGHVHASYSAPETHDLEEASHSIHEGSKVAIERRSSQCDHGEPELRILLEE